VVSTEENPISYIWSSSAPSVATVDKNGMVTGVSEGVCYITATLEQNPDIQEFFDISVAESQNAVAWETTPPENLSAYESVWLKVVSDANVEWIFSGADQQAYSVNGAGNERLVNCWSGSVEPLRVTVRSGDSEISAVIPLIGI
jgi:hypothetical protein